MKNLRTLGVPLVWLVKNSRPLLSVAASGGTSSQILPVLPLLFACICCSPAAGVPAAVPFPCLASGFGPRCRLGLQGRRPGWLRWWPGRVRRRPPEPGAAPLLPSLAAPARIRRHSFPSPPRGGAEAQICSRRPPVEVRPRPLCRPRRCRSGRTCCFPGCAARPVPGGRGRRRLCSFQRRSRGRGSVLSQISLNFACKNLNRP